MANPLSSIFPPNLSPPPNFEIDCHTLFKEMRSIKSSMCLFFEHHVYKCKHQYTRICPQVLRGHMEKKAVIILSTSKKLSSFSESELVSKKEIQKGTERDIQRYGRRKKDFISINPATH